MLSEMWLSKNCNSGDQWVITQSWMGNSDLAPAANYMSQSDQDKNHKLKIEKKVKAFYNELEYTILENHLSFHSYYNKWYR